MTTTVSALSYRQRLSKFGSRLVIVPTLLSLAVLAGCGVGSTSATKAKVPSPVSSAAPSSPRAITGQIALYLQGQNVLTDEGVRSAGIFYAVTPVDVAGVPGSEVGQGTWTQAFGPDGCACARMTFRFDSGDAFNVEAMETRPLNTKTTGATGDRSIDVDSVLTVTGGTGVYASSGGVFRGTLRFVDPSFDPETGAANSAFTGSLLGGFAASSQSRLGSVR